LEAGSSLLTVAQGQERRTIQFFSSLTEQSTELAGFGGILARIVGLALFSSGAIYSSRRDPRPARFLIARFCGIVILYLAWMRDIVAANNARCDFVAAWSWSTCTHSRLGRISCCITCIISRWYCFSCDNAMHIGHDPTYSLHIYVEADDCENIVNFAMRLPPPHFFLAERWSWSTHHIGRWRQYM
jgi:hypothetical protein